MTSEDLKRIYRENAWEIAKETGKAGFKAFRLEGVSLSELTDVIADAYGLDQEDRRRLAPMKSIDLLDGAAKTASVLKESAGAVAGLKLANDARRSGALMKTGKALIRGGMVAAKAAAKVGHKSPSATKATQQAGHVVPYAAIATTAYAVGSAGFFAARARRFNLACYELVNSRLADRAIQQDPIQPVKP